MTLITIRNGKLNMEPDSLPLAIGSRIHRLEFHKFQMIEFVYEVIHADNHFMIAICKEVV